MEELRMEAEPRVRYSIKYRHVRPREQLNFWLAMDTDNLADGDPHFTIIATIRTEKDGEKKDGLDIKFEEVIRPSTIPNMSVSMGWLLNHPNYGCRRVVATPLTESFGWAMLCMLAYRTSFIVERYDEALAEEPTLQITMELTGNETKRCTTRIPYDDEAKKWFELEK